MTGKSFRGKDHCCVCGHELHWHCPADPDSVGDAAESPAGTDIPADMTATGKEEDGSIRFEVVCTCPDCRTRNKYFISAKMI